MRCPTVRLLRTRYPDLAGVLLRDWERDGCRVSYGYDPRRGFSLVAVRPRWRWLLRLIFRFWLTGQPRPQRRGDA